MNVCIYLKSGKLIKIDEKKLLESTAGKYKVFETYESKDTYYQDPYRGRKSIVKIDSSEIEIILYNKIIEDIEVLND